MSTRYEKMLEAIANGETITEEPICRREMFLKALANKEGASNLPEPICREEQFYKSIILGETITEKPICKKEEYLKAIANKEPIPESSSLNCKEQALLRKVCTKTTGGGSGGTTPTPTQYTITFGTGVTVMNGSTKLTSGTKVNSGTSLTVSYTLTEHYHLTAFKVNGTEVANNSTITVTSNVTITFTQAIDTYSVTFGAGVSVLNGSTNVTSGEQVAYGTSLVVSYTLTDGYKLTSFQVNGVDAENNSTITVTGNIDIVFAEKKDSPSSAVTFSRTFAENTPETISAVSTEISANNMTSAEVETTYGWKLGDTISYQLSTGENIEMRIIGFNHDDLSDGSGKAGITLNMTHCLATEYNMNNSMSTAGGYASSVVRTSTLPTIKSQIPQEWQDVIKFVNKQSVAGGSTSAEILTLSDDIFLLSVQETGADTKNTSQGAKEGVTYEYWQGKEDAYRIKMRDTDSDGIPETNNFWLTRTIKGGSNVCSINSSGVTTNAYASNRRGLSFAFCV